MLSLLVERHRRVHRRHAVQGVGRRRPGARAHDLRRPQDLDHGQAAEAAAATRASIRATPTRRPSPTSSSTTGSCGSGAGSTPRATEPCTALGEPATLILLGDDYDGGHKAWVRWPDGSDDIVPGFPRASAVGRRLASSRVAKDKIPTSRVGRTAKIGGLAAGQAIRQAGTRAANVARTEEGARPRSSAATSRPPSRSSTALGTMKGAAMKLGQVMSFLDVGHRARRVPRGVPAQARGAPRRRAERSPSRTCAR